MCLCARRVSQKHFTNIDFVLLSHEIRRKFHHSLPCCSFLFLPSPSQRVCATFCLTNKNRLLSGSSNPMRKMTSTHVKTLIMSTACLVEVQRDKSFNTRFVIEFYSFVIILFSLQISSLLSKCFVWHWNWSKRKNIYKRHRWTAHCESESERN